MAGAEARLAELGIVLPEVAPPVAAYVPAVVTGSYVYTSGQLPFIDGALPATGKVGEERAGIAAGNEYAVLGRAVFRLPSRGDAVGGPISRIIKSLQNIPPDALSGPVPTLSRTL